MGRTIAFCFIGTALVFLSGCLTVTSKTSGSIFLTATLFVVGVIFLTISIRNAWYSRHTLLDDSYMKDDETLTILGSGKEPRGGNAWAVFLRDGGNQIVGYEYIEVPSATSRVLVETDYTGRKHLKPILNQT